MALTKNIVTDYGCPTDGTSDCRAAFLAFRGDAQGKTAILNVPPGRYNFPSSLTNDGYALFKGIPDLTVNMSGATFLDNAGEGGYAIGAGGNVGEVGTFARIDSLSSGALSATCKAAADATIFTAGRYALLTGLDLQGLWGTSYGYPFNHYYFEYVKISGVNATTGVVTFASSIRHSYLDTWPHYAPGAYPDQGGPATLYAIDPSWDCSLKFNGGTFTGTLGAINCAGRDIVFRNYTQTGFCINPSQNGSMRFIDSTLGYVEVDKIVGTYALEGTTTATQIQFQNSSVDLLYLSGSANVSNLNGTPKKVIADPGTTIGSLNVGCSFGRTEELYFNSCTINAVVMPGGTTKKGPSDAGWQGHAMSGGMITVPNTENALDWAIPGTWCYWEGALESETSFQVLSVTQDATNTYVQTSMADGFPSVPLAGGTKLYIRPHPAPKATFINCTGCAEVVDWSQTGMRPFASYTKRTYDKNSLSFPYYYVSGWVQSISFNVTTAFAGAANPLTLHGLAQFDNCAVLGPPASYVAASYGPIINLRQSGNRVITPSGVTGVQSGDSGLALPYPQTWLTGIIWPFFSSDVSADAANFSVTIEVITNNGPEQSMASDFILIDTTTTTATQAHLLKNYVATLRQAYELGTRVKDIMLHAQDGTTFTDLEKLFGVPAGQGQVIFDLVNGSVGSMQGNFQVDDAKEITERVV